MQRRIAVYGKTPEKAVELKKELSKHGFILDDKKPDIVISYGGDGTFLAAERTYPEIPKALFRYSKICKKCHDLPISHAVELLERGKFRIINYPKIEAKIGKQTLVAANDIVVRNALPIRAMRFTLSVNGKKIDDEIIGDGILVATAFGATGYFYSITRKTFDKGIGIAFNNTTIAHHPMFLKKTRIKLTVTRGTGLVGADNNQKIMKLKPGQSVTITISRKKTRLIQF